MKRHLSLASLSSDHHHGLNISRMLSSLESKGAEEIAEAYKKLVDFYINELVKHFQEEETCLVPPLKDNAKIMRMCREHNKLHEIFASLNSTDDLKNGLISFGRLLESHIRFEERELFPMIESTLPEERLIEIGNMMKLNKGS